jgi:hypothetical protein
MNDGGRSAMLYDLLSEDLSGFEVRRFPVTDALQDQKVRSWDPFTKWWFDKLDDGQLLEGCQWLDDIPRDRLTNDCCEASARAMSPQDLAARLKKVLPAGYPKDGKRLCDENGRRSRTWVFPSLEECRAHFERLHRGRYRWSPEE